MKSARIWSPRDERALLRVKSIIDQIVRETVPAARQPHTPRKPRKPRAPKTPAEDPGRSPRAITPAPGGLRPRRRMPDAVPMAATEGTDGSLPSNL